MRMDKPVLVGGVSYPNVIKANTLSTGSLGVNGDLLAEFIARVASAYPDYTFKATGKARLVGEDLAYSAFHVCGEGLAQQDEHIMTVEEVYRNHGPCLHLHAQGWKKHTKNVKLAVKTFASKGANKSPETVMQATIYSLQEAVASIRRDKEWEFNSTQTDLNGSLRDALRIDPAVRAEVFAMGFLEKEKVADYEVKLRAFQTALRNANTCESVGTFIQVTPAGKCLVTYASRGDSVDTYESTYSLPEAIRASIGILKISPKKQYVEGHGISSAENQYYIAHA